jgi:diguanylate cyclase (GGDEF)-like protein
MMQNRRSNCGFTSKLSTLKIVDSLAEITRYKDRELLERSLAVTLSELFLNDEFRFYRITTVDNDGVTELRLSLLTYANQGVVISEHQIHEHELPPWLLELVTQAVETQALVERYDSENAATHILYPVYTKHDDIYGMLLHKSKQASFESRRLIYGLLRIYSNYLSLLEESHRDTLTNLLNREILDSEITKIIVSNAQYHDYAAAKRRRTLDGTHAWLCLLDVDHFKRINDEWGHLYGDEVLILLARQLENIFRKEDLLFRYGGEEFVALFRTFSCEDAQMVCERTRNTIAQYSFPGVGRVTISIGVAEITRQPGSSIVLGQADKALYYAKEHGRNQSCFYDNLLAQGLIEPQTINQSKSSIDFF